jgi:lupus La protein
MSQGSVFVEFADFKSVDDFLKADPKPSWKGEDLLIMTKCLSCKMLVSIALTKGLSREAYCDMKIKEKGLTGKAATNRKDLMVTRPRGFNAFQEMAKGDKGKSKGGKDKAKPEIWLEFMGTRLRVHEDNGGSVKIEDVPYVKGSTLKFTGCGGDVSFKDIKVSLFR